MSIHKIIMQLNYRSAILVLAILFCYESLVAQNLLPNGEFHCSGCALQQTIQPVSSCSTFGWNVSDGIPYRIIGGLAPYSTMCNDTDVSINAELGNCPIIMEAMPGEAAGIYSNVNFIKGHLYYVSFDIKMTPMGLSSTDFHVYASSSLLQFDSQPIYSQVNLSNNDYSWNQRVNAHFIPNQDYSYIWFYLTSPYNENCNENICSIRYANVQDISCCTNDKVYTNTSSLQQFTQVSNSIKASTSVQVAANNYVTFQAGNYVELNPGFEALTSSNFSASIAPCQNGTQSFQINAGPDLSICRPLCDGIGTASAPDITYSWTSTPANAIDILDAVNISNPSLCNFYNGEFQPVLQSFTYTLTAKNYCYTSVDNVNVTVYNCPQKMGLYSDEAVSEIVYPNPTKGDLVINIPSVAASTEISVYNDKGVQVYQETTTKSNSIIDLNNKEDGIYFVKIKTDKGVFNRKILIVR